MDIGRLGIIKINMYNHTHKYLKVDTRNTGVTCLWHLLLCASPGIPRESSSDPLEDVGETI